MFDARGEITFQPGTDAVCELLHSRFQRTPALNAGAHVVSDLGKVVSFSLQIGLTVPGARKYRAPAGNHVGSSLLDGGMISVVRAKLMAEEKPDPPHSPEQRLRADIDSGRTGDKVAASDPAAVPLGTDAEAGGVPTDAGAASRARQAELDRVETPHRRKWHSTLILPGLALLVVAVFAFVLLN